MKRLMFSIFVASALGTALAWDEELAWKYDDSARPADKVSVWELTRSAGVDARACTWAMTEAAPLETRPWTMSFFDEFVHLFAPGTLLFIR